jgi:hypothetical protein
VAINNNTNFKVMNDTSLSFAFDFRDWKYLSNVLRFSHVISDPNIISGNKNGTIQL